jgi:hypothetical protein
MGQECEFLAECGLFTKHQPTNDLACQGFIKMYCQGPKMGECKRLEHRLRNGMPPSDDMLPSGNMLLIKSEDENLSQRSASPSLTGPG